MKAILKIIFPKRFRKKAMRKYMMVEDYKYGEKAKLEDGNYVFKLDDIKMK